MPICKEYKELRNNVYTCFVPFLESPVFKSILNYSTAWKLTWKSPIYSIYTFIEKKKYGTNEKFT
jgi:hypothetical protein